ncbi:MAG: hypothetical protein JRK53_07570, partial [Deltaproteobacteria bacterium]|nr:hypothetical protein [Deltaproteobacteria bacterium]
ITWYEARNLASCMSYMGLPGHLATITSKEEDGFVRTNLPIETPRVWLGGTDEADEGNWRWITGESFVWAESNTNGWGWDSQYGEPNGGTGENCMDYDDGSVYWNDTECERDEIGCFLVEFEEIEPIPTLSNYGIFILIMILAGSFYFISRRKTKYSCN